MVGISEMTDLELQKIIETCEAGGDAYNCAMSELLFRDRHPDYRVV